jgi:hypothetical protein
MVGQSREDKRRVKTPDCQPLFYQIHEAEVGVKCAPAIPIGFLVRAAAVRHFDELSWVSFSRTHCVAAQVVRAT